MHEEEEEQEEREEQNNIQNSLNLSIQLFSIALLCSSIYLQRKCGITNINNIKFDFNVLSCEGQYCGDGGGGCGGGDGVVDCQWKWCCTIWKYALMSAVCNVSYSILLQSHQYRFVFVLKIR